MKKKIEAEPEYLVFVSKIGTDILDINSIPPVELSNKLFVYFDETKKIYSIDTIEPKNTNIGKTRRAELIEHLEDGTFNSLYYPVPEHEMAGENYPSELKFSFLIKNGETKRKQMKTKDENNIRNCAFIVLPDWILLEKIS